MAPSNRPDDHLPYSFRAVQQAASDGLPQSGLLSKQVVNCCLEGTVLGDKAGIEVQERKAGLTRLDPLAEDGDLVGAGLVELRAQAHVARLDDVELQLLLAAAVRQLLEVVP